MAEANPQDPQINSLRGQLFRSLRYRNFRLFFFGQGISLIGTWMQQVAMSWLVYDLTHRSFVMGVVGFVGQIPMLLLAPLAGVYSDRWDRHRIMYATQSLSMLQAFIIAGLVLSGRIAVWQIIPLQFFLGCVNAFDMPARQAYFVSMIGRREDLNNAIALNSSIVNGARLIGPFIAGVAIAMWGTGPCFLLNGISYWAVLASLLAMQRLPHRKSEETKPVLEHLKEGMSYAFGFPPIRAILLLLMLVSLVGVPYVVLMPIIADQHLHGGPHAYSLLMCAAGLGALLGAVRLAIRKSVVGLVREMALATVLFGAGLIAFSLSTSIWLSLACLVLGGFGMITTLAASNTVLQTLVDDSKRGRIMSLYAMAFMGMTPFGNLMAGTMGDLIGVPHTIMAGGVACVAGGIFFGMRLEMMRELIRPIYIKKGIMPGLAPPPDEARS